MKVYELDEILENICDNYCLHSCSLEFEDDANCENCPLDEIRNLFIRIESERDKIEIKNKALYRSLIIARSKLVSDRPKIAQEDKQ